MQMIVMESIPYNTTCRLSTLMPRLPCFCKYAECGSAVVDSRTFDRHKRNDLSKHVQDAIAATTTACKSQDDAIAEHLASLSLSGDCPISSNSTTPLHQSTTSSSQFSGKPTEQKLVEKPLCQLRDIETLLEDLTASVHGNLGGIGTPGAAKDAFPLLPVISTARTLRNQLSGMTSRAVSVQETKQSLLARLGEVVTKLEAADEPSQRLTV